MGSRSPEEPAGLPPGRFVELPGRGRTFVREMAGPPAAPPLILVHAFVATGGLNWFGCFEPLGRRFRVLAPDLRGHGRGLRSGEPFRFEDCADDVAALAAELGVTSAILGGYSMGGPICQLVWKRHRGLVQGLVFSATSYQFVHGGTTRLLLEASTGALAQILRVGDVAAHLPLARGKLLPPTPVPAFGAVGRWGAAEVRRHDLRALLEAGAEIGRYDAESWIGQIDVPTAVVLTTYDKAVDPLWQLRLARVIRGATLHPVAEGHVACGRAVFGPVFTEACERVAARVAQAPLPASTARPDAARGRRGAAHAPPPAVTSQAAAGRVAEVLRSKPASRAALER